MYLLGIDLGTTTVKLIIADENKSIVALVSDQHKADIGGLQPGYNEQNVSSIIQSFVICMNSLALKDSRLLTAVGKIGICGQMHGCVLWSSRSVLDWAISMKKQFEVFSTSRKTSNLITWQDKRATKIFIDGLHCSKLHRSLHSGFGCVTLIWMKRYQDDLLNDYDCCGTIGDLIVAILCKLPKALMTTQNAASWGFYNDEEKDWDRCSLSYNEFPIEILPTIVEPLEVAGTLVESVFLLPAQATVYAALGDSQCSVLPFISADTAVLNIGTAAQVSYIIAPPYSSTTHDKLLNTLAYCPFFDQNYLAMAASLNGGNVLDHFVQLAAHWATDISGYVITPEMTWSRINYFLSSESSSSDLDSSSVLDQDDFVINPHLFGERHDTGSLLSIYGMRPNSDLRLVRVFLKLAQSIVSNLEQMAPQSLLINNGIRSITLTSRGAKESYFGTAASRTYPQLRINSYDSTSIEANFSAAYGCTIALLNKK